MASKPVATSPSLLIPPGCRRRQQVAGDLVADELGVRQVAVEGGDDPVAVAPGFAEIALGRQLDQVAGVGVADDVEPVPAPALAVPRRGQQAIDDARERVGRVGRRGRRRSPRASAAGRSGRRWPVGSACAGRRARRVPARSSRGPRAESGRWRCELATVIADGRHGDGLDRLEGPEPSLALTARAPLLRGCAAAARRLCLGPGKPHRDPAREDLDLAVRAASPWAASSALARSGSAWMSRLAAGSPATAAGPLSPPFRMLGREVSRRPPLGFSRVAVAWPAFLDQERAHVLLEELGVVRGRRCSCRRGSRRGEQQEEKKRTRKRRAWIGYAG